MKKWLLFLVVIVLVICSYFLFFFSSSVSSSASGRCTLAAVHRCFADTSRWAEWWPKSSGIGYSIKSVTYNEVTVSLGSGNDRSMAAAFRIAPLTPDSILIQLECGVPGFFRRAAMKERMAAVLDSFRSFVQDAKNIYGVNFHRAMSPDTTLVTMQSKVAAYPSTDEVYRKIDSLKAYIAGEGAAPTGLPWLNVTRERDSVYQLMVAMPTNKRLAGNKRIMSQRFVPWRMIEGDVYGGPHAIERALQQLQLYKLDNVMTIIALPYQYLLTDRRQESDTTKWVTRICAPITW